MFLEVTVGRKISNNLNLRIILDDLCKFHKENSKFETRFNVKPKQNENGDEKSEFLTYLILFGDLKCGHRSSHLLSFLSSQISLQRAEVAPANCDSGI